MPNVPVAGQGYTFTVSLASASTGEILSNPTIAAGDFEISTDDGAYASLGTTPTVTPASSGIVKFTLTSGEVGTSHFTVKMIDAAGSEWKTLYYHETVGDDVDAAIGTVTDLGSGATLAANLADMAGATFTTSTDSLEAIRNRGDAAWTSAAQSVFGLTILEAEIITKDYEGKLVQ